jgi:hypothetical protein
MIVFDLRCEKAHVFEAWFPDSAAFERQRKKGQVTCPVCGATKVEKALMAPNIASGREKEAARESQQAATMMQELVKLRRHVESNAEYVGPKFADEALKIHYGETEKRGIYGEATKDEAKTLREEGVEVAEIPWVPLPDS